MVTHAPPQGVGNVETFQTPLWNAPHAPLEQRSGHPHTGF